MMKKKARSQLSTEDKDQQYRIIFEAASDGMIISDLESGLVVEANPAAYMMHGYKREEFIGLQLTACVHSDSQYVFSESIQVFQSDGVLDIQTLDVRRDGSTFYAVWGGTAFTYQSRPCLLGIVRDVSKRIQAEHQIQQRDELLRQSEARYRSLFTSMNEGFALCEIICDDGGIPCDYRFLEVNAAFERQTGISVADILGKTIRERFPDIEMSWIEIYGKVALTGEPARFENYNHNTGRHYEVFSFSPAKGKFAMLFMDISEHKQAEAELRESRAVLQAILDSARDPIYIKDHQSRIVMANPAMAKVVGKPLDKILGKTDSEFYGDPAIGQALRDNDLRIMTTDQGEIVEETVLTPTGHRIFLSSKTPYHNAAGEIIGLIGISHDITERKQAEHDLGERMKELQAFYGLAKIAEKEGITLGKLYQELADILPKSWQYPEITCARIVMGDSEFRTENFAESAWMQSAPVKVNGAVAGRLDVGYLEQKPKENEGPFLKEERLLIDAIAERVGRITERKQAEEALRESNERFRAIASNTPDHILMQDSQLRYTFVVNPQLGLTEQDMLGKTDYDFLSKEEADKLTQTKTQVMESGQPVHFETSLISKSGEAEFFDGSYIPKFDAQGKVDGLIGYFRNVTERKQAEEAQAWLASFPMLNPSPIIEVDFSGNIHYLNPTAHRLFPDLQEKGRGHPWLHELETIFVEFSQGGTGTKTTARDVQIGEATYRQIISYVAENQRVRIYGFDITARIKAEEALRQTRDELEIRVQERTQELKKTNEQLQTEIAERHNLAQNLHDAVNQSLFSAGLIAEVLPHLWDRDQESARRSLEDLRRLTRGAQAEMRGLLAELRPSTLTDAELGDLLRLLGNSFSGRTNIPVTVTINGGGSLPAEVQVAIYRICQETLNNVAKYAGAGMVEIVLKHEDTAIELNIRDDGQGFDPERIAAGHYGLSMMRERAEAVGALLSITSQAGHGTELTIRWAEAGKKEAL